MKCVWLDLLDLQKDHMCTHNCTYWSLSGLSMHLSILVINILSKHLVLS